MAAGPARRWDARVRSHRLHPSRLVLTAVVSALAVAVPLLPAVPASLAAASAPPDAPVTYVHDALGRLATVMDPNGDLARYEYDAAGNIVSISRATAPARGIVDVSPKVVSPGGTLNVVGRGFAAAPGDNVVRIDGKVATVTSASPTQLVVTVPADATSGAVTVTTPAGVAAGASVTVEASRRPTVTGVPTGVVGPGQSITVTGTGFSTGSLETWVAINNTRAVVTAVTATSVTATVPDYVTSGKVTVGTPYGRAVSAKDLAVAPAPLAPADVAQTVRGTVGQLRTITLGRRRHGRPAALRGQGRASGSPSRRPATPSPTPTSRCSAPTACRSSTGRASAAGPVPRHRRPRRRRDLHDRGGPRRAGHRQGGPAGPRRGARPHRTDRAGRADQAAEVHHAGPERRRSPSTPRRASRVALTATSTDA